jgi:hypothetical protein
MDDRAGDDGRPDDRLRARAGESRSKLWLYLEADRRVVVATLVVAVALTLLATGLALPGAAAKLRGGDAVDTLFQGLLTATITGVTLVLTLNQLVLSQELGAVGDQRERMVGALEFRDDAVDRLDVPVAPARPAEFLRALVVAAGRHAADLEAAVDPGAPARDGVVDLTGSLTADADAVAADLDGAQFGEFDVVSAALNFDYSRMIFDAKRLRATESDLGADAERALDRLLDVLELFGPAREHVKTLYFQWELIDLSRAMLASALPALLVAVCTIAFFDPTGSIARSVGVVPAVAVATTVSMLPFLVLLAYVPRIATVAKRTLSIGPFILRDTDRVASVARSDDGSGQRRDARDDESR